MGRIFQPDISAELLSTWPAFNDGAKRDHEVSLHQYRLCVNTYVAEGSAMDSRMRGIHERLLATLEREGIDGPAELHRRCPSVAASSAGAYIRGTRTPSYETCGDLAKCLRVRQDWLYRGDGVMTLEAAPIILATPAELTFAAAEEAFLLAFSEIRRDFEQRRDRFDPDRFDARLAQAIAAALQLIASAQPNAPPGMSQQETVRHLVRNRLDLLLAPKAEE